ncbi:MAG TPA: hypothetical protein EYN07_08785 [Flavobacteriaceae bacterium]|mgnify:FL=1|jgi:hypothetical protein|nr:hypothetical protein [Flavobacteriaceae bacterium]MAM30518.1 hypothetical protein [Flavobacteriaceae bacterium]MAY52660.1 hypothetical protein [Flavobacteriaceae bacterium]HBR55485.1 hypothetical protein [Flavobacteriaceae bacterium]HIB47073.1 hypothetical protein [Flavobacteriaceae bacterium]|tara:strand:- start:2757 stop:3809 length:1053 start_codon:yes stop_codon:yes gene_type:complete
MRKLISKKKPAYPISEELSTYLTKHARNIKIPIYYDDLLRFQGSVTVFDAHGNDTLWIQVYYSEFETQEIEESLKRMYSILHSDGSDALLPYLNIDRIDFCTFGNSKPFRIKVRNILNDNYIFLYIKKADASRIYGLELEHLLSPNHINFLIHGNTLIEEHISGIPGDDFIAQHLEFCSEQDKREIAKEFVKFNERCFVRLLGDMRSYNYVMVLTNDFDRIQYRIRAIDFDQQSYEGNQKVYKPQFLKENNKLVQLTARVLEDASIEQYKREERSLLAKRATSEKDRLNELLSCMKNDTLSPPEKMKQLRKGLLELTGDVNFKKSKNMGEILESALDFIVRNYETENPFL